VYIYRSYYKNKLGGPFFWTTLYSVYTYCTIHMLHCCCFHGSMNEFPKFYSHTVNFTWKKFLANFGPPYRLGHMCTEHPACCTPYCYTTVLIALTPVSQILPTLNCLLLSRHLGTNDTGFQWVDVLLITQPTASRYWRKHRPLTSHSFFLQHQTPDSGRLLILNQSVLWCHYHELLKITSWIC